MRKMKIVSDSSCDLFELKHTAFSAAPMKIITDEREFADDAALDVDAMVDFFSLYKGRSSSSCPNVADWLKAFGDADDIFCVTITSGLSGSYNAACAAKKIFEEQNEGKRVFVLDSLSAGPELTLMLEKIEECIGRGMRFEDICECVTEYRGKTGLVFVLKSLKTFANNGRVSPITAKLIGIAGICIVGKASEQGTLEPMHKCKGEKRSLETMIKAMEAEGFCSGKIRIGHCQNRPAAERIRQMLLEKFESARIEIHPLRGLCSFYTEKGSVLVGFEKE